MVFFLIDGVFLRRKALYDIYKNCARAAEKPSERNKNEKGNTKRILSAIAAAIMTVSLFSGCAADEAVQEEKDTISVYL